MKNKVTLTEIAEKAGVSVITASRAVRGVGRVNEQTRSKVLKIAEKMGYLRNSGMIHSKANPAAHPEHCLRIILPIFPSGNPVGESPYKLSRIVTELMKNVEAAGGVLTVAEVNDPEDLLTKMPRARQQGIILRQVLPESWTRQLMKIAPVVYGISHDVIPGIDCVNFSEGKSTAILYNHLLEHGHRNILWAAFDRNPPRTNVAEGLYNFENGLDRQGFNHLWVRVATWSGLDLGMRDHFCTNRTIIIKRSAKDAENAHKESGLELAQKIMAMKNRPTAVVTSSEGLAYHLCCSLRENGIKVPGDISIATYLEDSPSAHPDVDFTRIQLPYKKLSLLFLEMIQRRISSPGSPHITVSLDTELVVGDTVGFAS